jgi:hypothetical protein
MTHWGMPESKQGHCQYCWETTGHNGPLCDPLGVRAVWFFPILTQEFKMPSAVLTERHWDGNVMR